jgi:flagellar hook-length control protein FliK
METQPTQQGLMQLFMSLGLSTADSLATLGEGEKPEVSGFDSLLAGYLPDSGLAAPNVATDPAVLSDMASLLTEVLPDDGKTVEAIGVAKGEVESLPLLHPRAGKELPLSQLVITKDSLNGNNESSSAVDEKVQALLDDQGFYAQSLVSNTLQASIPVTNTSVMNSSEKNSAAHALASFQARGAVNNKTASNTTDQLSAAEISDLNTDDDAISDRFLGAARKSLDSLSASSNSLSPSPALTSSSLTPAQLMASAESHTNLALSMGEDPIQQSLQDLTALEDGEKIEVDAKLLTTERKQDDQSLKLSKGQQAWGDALSERISMNAAKNIKQVTIHLDPPELGSLELKLHIKDDQQTQVQVQVQNPQVKEALESSAHRLREMLANEGLELTEFNVQTGSEHGAGGEQGNSEQGLAQEQQNSDTSSGEEQETLNINLPKNNNLLDTFV